MACLSGSAGVASAATSASELAVRMDVRATNAWSGGCEPRHDAAGGKLAGARLVAWRPEMWGAPSSIIFLRFAHLICLEGSQLGLKLST